MSSPKHAEPHVRGCPLEGRNMDSRSVLSSVKWDCRLSGPLYSPCMGSGRSGSVLEVCLVTANLIVSPGCGWSPHPNTRSERRVASKHVCPGCVGIWRSMARVRESPRIRSLWGNNRVFWSHGVILFVWWSMTLIRSLDGLVVCVALFY